jgi:GNAT superfamily N-acetyltransferase/N-acetylglutamate synthase-like GNAT family acetyltransferase
MSTLEMPHPVDENLVLRAARDDADVEKVIAINAEVHGPNEGHMLRHWLYAGHPRIRRADWLFVEDVRTGQAVATLSVMPVTWRYGSVTLPVAEMGFVATRPDYRGRGLQRWLSKQFDQIAMERGNTLAAIEGIAGFYGQFGYEYAVPLIGGFDLEYDQVPETRAGGRFTTRRASAADVPQLERLYALSVAALDVTALRSAQLWEHQVSVPADISFYGVTTVLERDGQVVGYMRWVDDDWMNRWRIVELGVDPGAGERERILALLRFARDRAQQGSWPALRLQLPESHPAVTVARYLGARSVGYYGWQMKVLDPAAFMRAIAPALETRLAASVLAGYDGWLVFNLFRSRLALQFGDGELVYSGPAEEGAPTDVQASSKQATQLWLGWRGRPALEDWYPDFSVRESARLLVDVLFPRAAGYIYVPY